MLLAHWLSSTTIFSLCAGLTLSKRCWARLDQHKGKPHTSLPERVSACSSCLFCHFRLITLSFMCVGVREFTENRNAPPPIAGSCSNPMSRDSPSFGFSPCLCPRPTPDTLSICYLAETHDNKLHVCLESDQDDLPSLTILVPGW